MDRKEIVLKLMQRDLFHGGFSLKLDLIPVWTRT